MFPQTTIHQLDELDDNEKQYYFICNHYRSEKNLIGLAPHKDFGFITLLSMNKPGFIAHLHGVWGTILPKENYFLVNLGKALETLVNDTSKLTAVLHAVEYITDLHGRVSFGLSVEGNLDSPVYKLSENDSLEIIHPTFQAYLEECFKKTYGMINYEI